MEESAAQAQWLAKKCSFSEPSGPIHEDFGAMEDEIRRVFETTYKALSDMWEAPSVMTSSYHRAMRPSMTPSVLNGPRARSSLKRPRSSLEPMKRGELEREAPGNWVAYFDGA
jgi:hypothetical protein